LKGILHENTVSERGTSTSVLEYARALQDHAGIDISLAFRSSESHNARIVDLWRSEFQTLEYRDMHDLERQASRFGADFLYAQKSGRVNSTYLGGVRLLVHAVFQEYEPHGDSYAYISDWLAQAVQKNLKLRMRYEIGLSRNGSSLSKIRQRNLPSPPPFPTPVDFRKFKAVPYIVRKLSAQSDFRLPLGIPQDAFVLGSLSGSTQFDIPFVRDWIPKYLSMSSQHYFLCPNIMPFLDHPRAIFLPKILEEQAKADYLMCLDAMIHARQMGESFGMALCEALSVGKPVLSWNGGHDQNHVQILRDTNWLYQNQSDLERAVIELRDNNADYVPEAQSLVEQYTPTRVVQRFRDVFAI